MNKNPTDRNHKYDSHTSGVILNDWIPLYSWFFLTNYLSGLPPSFKLSCSEDQHYLFKRLKFWNRNRIHIFFWKLIDLRFQLLRDSPIWTTTTSTSWWVNPFAQSVEHWFLELKGPGFKSTCGHSSSSITIFMISVNRHTCN